MDIIIFIILYTISIKICASLILFLAKILTEKEEENE